METRFIAEAIKRVSILSFIIISKFYIFDNKIIAHIEEKREAPKVLPVLKFDKITNL